MPNSSFSSKPNTFRPTGRSVSWAFTTCRRVGDYGFRICGEDAAFQSLCEAIYPNATGPRSNGREPLYQIVNDRNGCVAAYSPRTLLKRSRTVNRLLVPLEWWITYDILYSDPRHLHLHGGGFRAGNAAVLLPGGHGAGKTSLTLEALYRGYRVYSDEILMVDPEEVMLRPYERCFVVKESGMSLFPNLQCLQAVRGGRKLGESPMVSYVNPVQIREDYLAPSAACRWIIFPRFRAGASTRLTPVGELEVVGRLLACVFTFFLNRDATLTGLAALARNCRAFDLEFGELHAGFDAIERLLTTQGAT